MPAGVANAALCAQADARNVRALHRPRVGKAMTQDKKSGKSLAAEQREARRAAALRANLRRRKEQARSLSDAPGATEEAEQDS
jgi:hypothetical protein